MIEAGHTAKIALALWLGDDDADGAQRVLLESLAIGLLGSLDLKGRIPVVQKHRVSGSQCAGHCRHRFVAAAADAVEGFALGLGAPRPQVQLAAHQLAVEPVQQLVGTDRQWLRIVFRGL